MEVHPQEWMALGISSNKPERVEGLHAPHMMAIVDEAKGVADPIFDAIDGALTPSFASGGYPGIRFYCSTPGSRMGKFYAAHTNLADLGLFKTFHTDGELLPNVEYQKWVNMKRREWGPDSSIYISKVRGQFPQEGDDVIIPLSDIEAAETAWEMIRCYTCGTLDCNDDSHTGAPVVAPGPHIVMGADIAAYGFNETVASIGTSTGIDLIKPWKHQGPAESAGRLSDLKREHGVQLIGIDAGGIGAAVHEQLRLREIEHLPIQFGAAPLRDPTRQQFNNLKAEMVFQFAAKLAENRKAMQAGFEPTYSMLHDDRLAGQLSNLRKRQAIKSGVPAGIKILDPDDPEVPASELPKGLRVSPDRAHSVVLCYHTAVRAQMDHSSTFVQPKSKTPLAQGIKRRRFSSYMLGRSSLRGHW
jgi:hypothetical protein